MVSDGPVGAPGWLTEAKQRYELATDFTLSWDRIYDRQQAITTLAYEDLPRAVAALEAVLALIADPWAPPLSQDAIYKAIESALRDAQGGAG